jgi:predicted DNA-binding helix-hairpin-helix protein
MEEEQRKKKRKRQLTLLKQEEILSETLSEMINVLEELRKERKYVDVQVCPKCKSAKVKRIGSMGGDMSGNMAITPVKYRCLDCGWRERLVIRATNRPLGWKEIALIAEALDLKKKNKEVTH